MGGARIRSHATILASVVGALVLACGGGSDGDAGEGGASSTTSAAVQITSPASGATIQGDRVTIELGAGGVSVVPAGTDQPNSGHHHLFIDRDVSPVGEPIPTEAGIVHLGLAQTSHVLEGLQPGEHTVIAVLGDFQHVRVGTVATDTVRFTVVVP